MPARDEYWVDLLDHFGCVRCIPALPASDLQAGVLWRALRLPRAVRLVWRHVATVRSLPFWSRGAWQQAVLSRLWSSIVWPVSWLCGSAKWHMCWGSMQCPVRNYIDNGKYYFRLFPLLLHVVWYRTLLTLCQRTGNQTNYTLAILGDVPGIQNFFVSLILKCYHIP